MSEFAKKVKKYYDGGLWGLARVQKALEIGKITQEEYEEIVKE
jgi:hypothetical protein